MRDISILVKPASGLCNMHCDYCFYCDEAQKRQQASYGMMSVETLRNVIKRTLMRTE
ncbi:MAG: anaerobic sulfatase maturase, partial [Oribacterium sp.]|nr:anaerobic sulfatase maturase [Oribacterium sp.]